MQAYRQTASTGVSPLHLRPRVAALQLSDIVSAQPTETQLMQVGGWLGVCWACLRGRCVGGCVLFTLGGAHLISGVQAAPRPAGPAQQIF